MAPKETPELCVGKEGAEEVGGLVGLEVRGL